jgi:hypothetical protein
VPFCTAVMENTRRVRCMWTINYDVEHKIYTETERAIDTETSIWLSAEISVSLPT